jgi:hypothetical protein
MQSKGVGGMDVVKDWLTLIIAIGSAGTIVWKVIKSANSVVKSVQELKKDNDKQREQNKVTTKGLLAALDGLQQIGANHNVTDAYNEIENYMINQLR